MQSSFGHSSGTLVPYSHHGPPSSCCCAVTFLPKSLQSSGTVCIGRDKSYLYDNSSSSVNVGIFGSSSHSGEEWQMDPQPTLGMRFLAYQNSFYTFGSVIDKHGNLQHTFCVQECTRSLPRKILYKFQCCFTKARLIGTCVVFMKCEGFHDCVREHRQRNPNSFNCQLDSSCMTLIDVRIHGIAFCQEISN